MFPIHLIYIDNSYDFKKTATVINLQKYMFKVQNVLLVIRSSILIIHKQTKIKPERIEYVPYVIMEKLEMNFIIYLNVSISAIKEKHSYKSKHNKVQTINDINFKIRTPKIMSFCQDD